MQITCTICSDLFVATDAVVGTNCGHLFHHQCLIQWLERSKSCPQCRAKSSEKSIYRIYFNIPNGTTEDTNTLQNKIDSLEFNMLLKKTELKKCKEEIAKFNTMSTGLKDEIKRVTSELKSAEANNIILKEQFHILKKRNDSLETVLIECERLRIEVKRSNNNEIVKNGTFEEVAEVLKSYDDPCDDIKSLVTMVIVLKKELHITAVKKKQLSTKLREKENKIFSLNTQVQRLQEKLIAQEDQNSHLLMEINHSTEERTSLMQKIEALQQAVVSPTASHPSASALKRMLAESPAPAALKRACPNDTLGGPATSPDLTSASSKEESPYLKIKASAFGLTPLRPNQANNTKMNKFSIFRKPCRNPLVESTCPREEEYDGMGGHSKPDQFPKRIPHIKVKKVNKHQRLSKIKLKDAASGLKMDMFLKK